MAVFEWARSAIVLKEELEGKLAAYPACWRPCNALNEVQEGPACCSSKT